MNKQPLLFLGGVLLLAGAPVEAQNLLLNSQFSFQSFESSRSARAQEFRSGSVPFWDQENYNDAEVFRAPRNGVFRPRFPVDGVVVVRPGKTLSQFSLLGEMELDNGDAISLSVLGYQTKPGALRATISQMRLDNATGTWSPADFGQNDKRTFPRHARGELTPADARTADSGTQNDFELKIENLKIVSEFKETGDASDDLPNTIGLKVEFTNTSDADVWIYSPTLTRSAQAQNRVPALRALPDYYRYIPRTITKLRRGEPLHIVTMGSSIDRASANPPLYRYDEDPKSPTFKQPLSKGDFLFDGAEVGRPELTPYIGQWRHYFSYTGRLRLELMRRWNYPVNKLLLNYMACDGSAIGESHSALKDWSSLALAPNPETNGQKAGQTWQELYPDVFARPEGARPDLVIFGSGANEKIDGPEEVAAFEGAIRWFQRHYPNTEIVFCMWQNREGYTPNTGMLKDLALRYSIPYIDFSREFSLSMRNVNSFALTPKDGHPQAAAHYIWGHLLARAFQPLDPIAPGVPQQQFPEPISPYTRGWEGDMQTYEAGSPRFYQGKAFVLDDTVVNVWAHSKDKQTKGLVDGTERSGGRLLSMTKRDARNSTFMTGRLSLGDRHILEVAGIEAQIAAADSKVVYGRERVGIEDTRWQLANKSVQNFASQWGAPYGDKQVVLQPGQKAVLKFRGDAVSVAWVDKANGGKIQAKVDGVMKWEQATDQPFVLVGGESVLLENRKGILNLAPGEHELEVTAIEKPVTLLGAFVYKTP